MTETAVLGSIAKTESLAFFIAINIGKVEIERQDYYMVSMLSPIGQLQKTKRKGCYFELNGKAYPIIDIL